MTQDMSNDTAAVTDLQTSAHWKWSAAHWKWS